LILEQIVYRLGFTALFGTHSVLELELDGFELRVGLD
jgi:hypothetical protein